MKCGPRPSRALGGGGRLDPVAAEERIADDEAGALRVGQVGRGKREGVAAGGEHRGLAAGFSPRVAAGATAAWPAGQPRPVAASAHAGQRRRPAAGERGGAATGHGFGLDQRELGDADGARRPRPGPCSAASGCRWSSGRAGGPARPCRRRSRGRTAPGSPRPPPRTRRSAGWCARPGPGPWRPPGRAATVPCRRAAVGRWIAGPARRSRCPCALFTASRWVLSEKQRVLVLLVLAGQRDLEPLAGQLAARQRPQPDEASCAPIRCPPRSNAAR